MKQKSLEDFEKQTKDVIKKFNYNWSLYAHFAHLVEEVGELGEAITVHTGERKAGSGKKALASHFDLREEIGDILFSTLAIATELNIDSTNALDIAFKRYGKKLKNLQGK